MGNYDGSFFVSTTEREGSGMPNGYAFVIVLILIALVGGLVYCGFEINDLRSRLDTAVQVNNTTIDQLTSCQQKRPPARLTCRIPGKSWKSPMPPSRN